MFGLGEVNFTFRIFLACFLLCEFMAAVACLVLKNIVVLFGLFPLRVICGCEERREQESKCSKFLHLLINVAVPAKQEYHFSLLGGITRYLRPFSMFWYSIRRRREPAGFWKYSSLFVLRGLQGFFLLLHSVFRFVFFFSTRR